MTKAMRLAALAAAYAFVCYVIVVAPAYAYPNADGAWQVLDEAAKPAQCRTVIRYSSERQVITTKDAGHCRLLSCGLSTSGCAGGRGVLLQMLIFVAVDEQGNDAPASYFVNSSGAEASRFLKLKLTPQTGSFA